MSDPDTEQSGDDEKDIVDHLSEATGYFHDDDAAKLRDIAEASGQKPVGIVKTAVEKEIERREWRCVHFEHDEDDEYPAANPYEYYRIHKKLQKEYEAAIDQLPKQDDPVYDRVQEEFERAKKTLEDQVRIHRAKAEVAEEWLRENGRDPDEDALIGMSDDPDPEDFEEVREVPWIEEGGGDE